MDGRHRILHDQQEESNMMTCTRCHGKDFCVVQLKNLTTDEAIDTNIAINQAGAFEPVEGFGEPTAQCQVCYVRGCIEDFLAYPEYTLLINGSPHLNLRFNIRDADEANYQALSMTKHLSQVINSEIHVTLQSGVSVATKNGEIVRFEEKKIMKLTQNQTWVIMTLRRTGHHFIANDVAKAWGEGKTYNQLDNRTRLVSGLRTALRKGNKEVVQDNDQSTTE